MTLFEIDERIAGLVDGETGEISDEGALDALMMEREEKIHNVAKWIMNLKSDVDALEEQEKKFKKRKESAKKKLEYLTWWLQNALGGEKRNYAECNVTYTKSVETVIDDISLIPEEFIRVTEKRDADKAAIKSAIGAGIEVNGARLVANSNIQVK